jgi:predicted nucleic acid-binding protein
MISRITIDASVFISRLRLDDVAHFESRAFLEALPGRPIITILPVLVQAEITGAMRRYTGDTQIARRALEVLDPLPNLNLAPVDSRLANEAAQVAAGSGVKGADAVYIATARLFDTTLVTLDVPQRDRAPAGVRAIGPMEALAELELVE